MKFLLTGGAAFLLITACGQKHKALIDPTPPGVEFFEEKLPTIEVQKGDPATAEATLKTFSLAKTGTGRVRFKSKAVNGDAAIFKDVILSAARPLEEWESAAIDLNLDPDRRGLFLIEGADLKVATLTFEGLATRAGQASFSRMTMSDVSFTQQTGGAADKKPAKLDGDEGEAPPAAPLSKSAGKIKTITLVNPSPEVANWVASQFGKAAPAEMPQGNAFAFDQWTVDDLRITNIEDGTESILLVNHLEVLDLELGSAAQLLLEGLSLQAADAAGTPTANIALGTFDVRRSKLVTLAQQPTRSGDAERAALDVFGLQNINPLDPGFERLQISGLSFDVEGAALKLPAFVSKVGRDPKGEAVRNQMASLGFQSLEISGAGDQVYDPATDLLTVIKGKNFFEIKDGFRLEFGASYEGTKATLGTVSVDRPLQSADTTLKAMRLHGAEISLKDYGLVDRMINLQATREGKDPAEYRKGIKQQLNIMSAGLMFGGGLIDTGMDPKLVSEMTNAASSFIQKPKTLTLRFQPQTPINVGAALEAGDFKTLTKKELGFSASNK
jgi:hypothetical protein